MSTWSTGYDFSLDGSMVTSGSYMYVAGYDKISQTNLSDGSIATLNWESIPSVFDIAIDGNFIYAVSSGSPTCNIYKIDVTNSTSTIFFSSNSSDSPPILLQPYGIAISGGYMYISNSSTNYISKISLTDPANDYDLNWVQNDLIRQPYGLYVLNNLLYVCSQNSTYSGGYFVIATIDLTTSNINVIYANNVNRFFSIVSYGNNLYVTGQDFNAGTGSIQQLSLDGTLINDSWATTPLIGAEGLCINGTYLYCANNDYGVLNAIYKYALPDLPVVPCFNEGTKILTSKGYRKIEDLRKGDLVKTIKNDYMPIYMIGKKEINHPALKENRIKEQLYKLSSNKYPEIFEDLILTGCHSILVSNFKDKKEKEKTIKINGGIYITDSKYRLPACVDEKATVYEKEGKHTIYHFALENENYYMNYGIYANGLLVETCSKRYLKELSDMKLIE
jgi:hypothetical protein